MRLRRRRPRELELVVELWHVELGRCVASRSFHGRPPLELAHELSVMMADGHTFGYADPHELRLRIKAREYPPQPQGVHR